MFPEQLTLSRPLVFFDIESTGVEVAKARIVELCGIKIHPDRTRTEFFQRFNPGMPIPPEATTIHGITNEMVANEPKLQDKLSDILSFFAGCDFAGYNIVKFDVPLLVEELLRNGAHDIPFADARFIDCYRLWQRKAPRQLKDALRHYADEEHLNAHSAQADVEATIKVFAGQLRKHEDLVPDLGHLHEVCNGNQQAVDYAGCFARNAEGELIFTFGQNKGKRIAENHGMLRWMLEKDFTAHTKQIARRILNGEFK
jgi:DNA polymerase III subunit epsilon